MLRERLNKPFNIMRIRRDQASEEGMTLSRMVKRTINYLATDPRDKVYALLSTVTQGTTLEPNYNLTKRMVYTAAFKAILQQDGDLSILSLVLTANESRDESLPSWVPDLSSERDMVPISAARDERVGRVYNVSPPHSKFPEGSMEFQDDDTVLVLTGLTVDTISCLGTAAPDMRLAAIRDYALHSMKEAMFSWGSLLIEHLDKNYITGCTKIEAFWRTITLDQKMQGYHPGYDFSKVGAARRLGNPDEWIPPPNSHHELRLFAALDSQGGGAGGSQFNRKFFTTTEGYMGLAPPTAQDGDVICILLGGEVPYVLRAIEDGYYKMIGEWYVPGLSIQTRLELLICVVMCMGLWTERR